MLKEEKEAEAALAKACVFEAAIAEEVNGETLSTQASEKQGESRQGQDNTQPKLTSHTLSQLPASTHSFQLQNYLKYSPDHHREDLVPDTKRFTPIKQSAISPIPEPASSLEMSHAKIIRTLKVSMIAPSCQLPPPKSNMVASM